MTQLTTSQRLIMLIMAVIWLSFLGYRDLIDPDEGRYAEIPREIVSTGDWLTPRLNDLKYFEKPILHYWMTAAVYKVFGENNTTARIVTSVGGLCTALWIFFIAARLLNITAAFYSYLICISSLIFISLGHIITLDMTLTLFLTVAYGCLLLAQSNRTQSKSCRNWMLFGYIMLSCAVLTKGPVALLLPAANIFLYAWIFKDWQIFKYLHVGKGTLLILALTSPWFIAVNQVNPEYFHFFFIQENLLRFTTNIHARQQPAWFFIVVLIIGAVPWMVQSLQALIKPNSLSSVQVADNTSSDKNVTNKQRFFTHQQFNSFGFLWLYCLFTLVFFSMSHSKLIPYILPIFPFLAMMVAKIIDTHGLSKFAPLQLLGFAVLLGIVNVRLPYMDSGDIPDVPAALAALQTKIWLVIAILVIGSAITLYLLKQTSKATMVLALTSLLAFKVLIFSYQDVGQYNSSKRLAAAIQPHLTDNSKIYSVDTFSHSLVFYLQRYITVVKYRGELAMGIDLEPNKAVPTIADFKQLWAITPDAVAVFNTKLFDTGIMPPLSYQVIYRDKKRVAISH